MKDSNCKGCRDSVHVDDETIEEMIGYIERRGHEMVEDIIYQKRLEACYKCENLNYKTTCKLCGCFVKVRAKMADSDCPNVPNSYWKFDES